MNRRTFLGIIPSAALAPALPAREIRDVYSPTMVITAHIVNDPDLGERFEFVFERPEARAK